MGYNQNVGKKRAREARRPLPWAPDEPLPCVVTALETSGVAVAVLPLRDGVHGAIVQRGSFLLAYVTTAAPPLRQRFTLAHELGHVRLGHDLGGRVDTYATMHGHRTSAPEVQANNFASEFLMPKAAICQLVPEGTDVDLEQVVRLAAGFGVSPLAMLFAVADCKRLSDARYDRLKAEIDDGDHLTLKDHLDGLVRVEDTLEALEGDQPYLSPVLRDKALGDLLLGRSSVAEVAEVSGADVGDLQEALDVLKPSGAAA